MKVLQVIPNLEFGNAAKQLTLLAPALTASGVHCRIAVLSGNGPLANPLVAANIVPDFIGWKRWIDPQPFLRLKQLIKGFSPDVIHCWGRESIRALALIGGRNYGARVIGSCVGKPSNGLLGKLEIGPIRRMDRLVFQWQVDLEKWKSFLPAEKLCFIPPGVGQTNPSSVSNLLGSVVSVPKSARVILCVGPLEPSKGFKEAIWAFHIIGFLFLDLHLIILGDGPDRARLDRMAKPIFPERVIFLGGSSKPRAYMDHAEMVWIPSLEPRGFNVALEAIAAGKPVIVSRFPGLADIVGDGEAGILVAPGDKVGLARETRLLLDDPTRSRLLGEAGRRRAQERFSVESMAHAYLALYDSTSKSA